MATRFNFTMGSPQYRNYRIAAWVIGILVIVLAAFAYSDVGQIVLGENKYSISLVRMNKAIAFAVAILGLQVVVGFTGQIALGQSFFFGMGAYLAAWLVEDHGWPYLLTLVVIIPVCFGFGMIFGIPALRIKGLYLALVTLGLAAIFPSLVQLDALFDYTNGAGGKTVSAKLKAPGWIPYDGVSKALQKIPVLGQYFGDGDLSTKEVDRLWKFTMFALLAGVCFWVVGNMVKSRPGRAIRAIRDNEIGAAVSGIDLSLYKTLSFGVASALGGVGGMIYVAELGIASPNDFTQLLAINFIVGLVVGGVGSMTGALLGGIVIAFIPEWASATKQVPGIPERWLNGPTGSLFLGVMLIILTFFMPLGIMSGVRSLRAKFVTIHPPDLSALKASRRPVEAGEAIAATNV